MINLSLSIEDNDDIVNFTANAFPFHTWGDMATFVIITDFEYNLEDDYDGDTKVEKLFVATEHLRLVVRELMIKTFPGIDTRFLRLFYLDQHNQNIYAIKCETISMFTCTGWKQKLKATGKTQLKAGDRFYDKLIKMIDVIPTVKSWDL